MRRSLLFVLAGDGTAGGTTHTTTGSTSGEAVTDTSAIGDSGETGLLTPGCPAGDVKLKTQGDVLAVVNDVARKRAQFVGTRGFGSVGRENEPGGLPIPGRSH